MATDVLASSEPAAAPNSPLVYGLGSFGLESVYKVFIGFYMFFYIDKLGLAVAMAAIINVIFGIWDAVNDPLVGFASDSTRTRWGRRKPWLLAGLPFYMGIVVLVYAVPKPFLQGNALFWYVLVIVFLLETAYTVVSVNYAALFPELFQTFPEQARAIPYYQVLGTLGELVGFVVPPFVYAQFGFVPMAMGFAAVGGFTLSLAIFRNHEDPKSLKAPPTAFKNAFGEVLSDRPFLWFTVAVAFLTFTIGVYTLATPFWVKYTLGASLQGASLILGVVFVVAILSVTVWGRLIRILGIKRTWLWAVGVMAASAIILGLASNLVSGALGAAAVGVGLGGIKVCREIIMAAFVDRGLRRTGHRREGIYYSLLRFIGKFSKVLQSIALVLLGLLFGYVSGENPGPQPANAFRFLISVFPLVFTIFAWLIASRLSFDDRQTPPHRG